MYYGSPQYLRLLLQVGLRIDAGMSCDNVAGSGGRWTGSNVAGMV